MGAELDICAPLAISGFLTFDLVARRISKRPADFFGEALRLYSARKKNDAGKTLNLFGQNGGNARGDSTYGEDLLAGELGGEAKPSQFSQTSLDTYGRASDARYRG